MTRNRFMRRSVSLLMRGLSTPFGAGCVRASGTDAGDQGLCFFHKRRAVMAFELGPGRKGARVRPVDEELAVEVVDLVLKGPRLQTMHHLVDGLPTAVPCLHTDVHMPLHHPPEIRDR